MRLHEYAEIRLSRDDPSAVRNGVRGPFDPLAELSQNPRKFLKREPLEIRSFLVLGLD
jgi:hypothetical protein